MEKKTLVTTAAPISAPVIESNVMSYLTNQDGKHYLVNVDLDSMQMSSKEIAWNYVHGLSACETNEGKFYYSEPMDGKVHMIQPNGVGCVAATHEIEDSNLIARSLFRRPALTQTEMGLATLSAAVISDGKVIESIVEENIVLPKGVMTFTTVGYYEDFYLFEERGVENETVNLGYVKNGRYVRLPVKFAGYLPTKDGVMGYKLGANGLVSHLCLLPYADVLKAINGDVRELKRKTKLKFNTKSVFGEHGCGVIPHVDIDTDLEYAAFVGEQGTHIVNGTQIVTVAQPLANGVLVTKGDLVVAIDIPVPQEQTETFDPQEQSVPTEVEPGNDW